jgi:Ca2+-binding RTX toxin-like protein
VVIGLSAIKGVEYIDAQGFAGVQVIGSSGNNSFDFTAATLLGIASIKMGQGADTLLGSMADDFVYGGAGNDLLKGNSGNDQLFGSTDNDILDGGEGVDLMDGGSGNDTFYVDSLGDIVIEEAGEGTDKVITTLTSFDLDASAANVENLTYSGSTDFLGTGSDGKNVIVGGSGNDALFGEGGNDTLTGNFGNDTLDGGTGNDSMVGGAGNDTYYVDATGDVVVETGGNGTDTIISSVTRTASTSIENIILVGSADINATGTQYSNTLTGNTGKNILTGLDGNDHLNGMDGFDTLVGGNGADTLDGGGGDDLLIGGAGVDRFVFGASGFGNDYISDFVATSGTGHELIDLRGLNVGFSDLTVTTDADGVVVSVGGHGVIHLSGVLASAVTADDFLFV